MAGYSIIDMEEIVIVTWDMRHEINGGDDDGNPTQVDAWGSRWSRKSREGQSQSSMKK